MKSLSEIEDELHMKVQRVSYWERFHSIPAKEDIENGGARI